MNKPHDPIRDLGPYKELLQDPRFPNDETENSPALLFEAVWSIEKKFSVAYALGDFVSRREGEEILINDILPKSWSGEGKQFPLHGFYMLFAVVKDALAVHSNISSSAAHELGLRAMKVALETLDIAWADFVALTGELQQQLLIEKDAIIAATREINDNIEVDYTYDIPTLALYAKNSARKLYVDNGFKRIWTLTSGEEADIVPYLMVHEVVEKSLLDACKFLQRGYFHSHQIAQRLEQEAVEAVGMTWEEYQYGIMVPEIDKAYTKPFLRIPQDLDLTAYRDLGETDLLAVIENADRERVLFVPSLIGEQIHHLHFADGARMAVTMMRFQEYYESPKFKGQYFTRDEFNIWYSSEKGGATYIQNWGDEGFNIPSTALTPFYEGHFSPLTEDESAVLEFFNKQKDSLFYIIATADMSDTSVLSHEIAHALYFLNPEYKAEIDGALGQVDTHLVKEFLVSHPEYASYHESVLDDEVHAYLAHSSVELANRGFDINPFEDLIATLGDIYQKYAPKTM